MVRDPWCMDPGAWGLIPGAWILVHGLVRDPWYLVPGAWCMVPCPWCEIRGTRCMDPGALSGTRSVVPGAWCVIPGAWILVHGLVRDPGTKGQESDRPQVRSGRDGTGSFEVASWAMHARGIVAFLDLAPWRNASKGIILFGLSLSVTKHGPFDAILGEFIEKPNEMSWHCPWGVHAPHGRTWC
ncbi:hypothetical protein RIF29_02035 [Crotalaria pallida]|uniref:Uncharacterized protein n=1 Tax=Crotalaria pallida TaxID=3830 RepID=A0AAN9IYR3_CROPI